MSESYLGHLPYTDEQDERLSNSEHLQSGTFGAKKTVLYDSSGTEQTIGTVTATAAALTNVTSSQASQSFLASNTSRKGCLIYNDSSAVLYVAYAATASATAFTIRINPNELWTMSTLFTGAISGIWEESEGAARVTELT